LNVFYGGCKHFSVKALFPLTNILQSLILSWLNRKLFAALPRCKPFARGQSIAMRVTMVQESFHGGSGRFSQCFRKVFTMVQESFPDAAGKVSR